MQYYNAISFSFLLSFNQFNLKPANFFVIVVSFVTLLYYIKFYLFVSIVWQQIPTIIVTASFDNVSYDNCASIYLACIKE